MSEHIEKTVSELIDKITKAEAAIAEDKKVVNHLSVSLLHREPPYVLSDVLDSDPRIVTPKADQFANESAPSTATRAFLAFRGKEAGAVPLDTIYKALLAGGFKFGPKDEETRKTGMRVAISKDPKIERIGEDNYGLMEWYPNRLKDKKGLPPLRLGLRKLGDKSEEDRDVLEQIADAPNEEPG